MTLLLTITSLAIAPHETSVRQPINFISSTGSRRSARSTTSIPRLLVDERGPPLCLPAHNTRQPSGATQCFPPGSHFPEDAHAQLCPRPSSAPEDSDTKVWIKQTRPFKCSQVHKAGRQTRVKALGSDVTKSTRGGFESAPGGAARRPFVTLSDP